MTINRPVDPAATQTTQAWFAKPVRLLAPMEGLSDPLMRHILTQIACDLGRPYDWSVSEFIRVTQQRIPDAVFYHYVPELKTHNRTAAGTPMHIQLLGCDPNWMAINAEAACALGALAIDLNFGCPAKTVNRHRGGAVLLDEPALMAKIITAVRHRTPTHIPVSVKIRLGLNDTKQIDAIKQAVADGGANWLTVHARTKAQGYAPPAYWDQVARFVDLPIPVVANGEIWNPADAKACQYQANTPHVMLGRGAVTRPDLIASIEDPSKQLTWQTLCEYQLAFLQGPAKTERMLIGRYKQWLGLLTKQYPQAATLWPTLKKQTDLPSIRRLLQASAAQNQSG